MKTQTMAEYANNLLGSINYGNIDQLAKEAQEMKAKGQIKVTRYQMPENVPADADMGTLD